MKTLSGTVIVVLVTIGLTAIVTVAVFAQSKKADPSKCGIRLVMGHKGEPLHCTEQSLNAALGKCDSATYKVRFHDKKDASPKWEKGELSDVTVTDISVPRKDTGGPTPEPMQGLTASGVHSTQEIAFSSTEELKEFVSALQPVSASP
jgi:hypothetical protein